MKLIYLRCMLTISSGVLMESGLVFASPTASLAMDSNTLCVISSKGTHFRTLGNMLWFKDWMKWAPSANQLAYISGEGRFL